MALLKFRVYFEEDNGIYRDIVIRHTQNFKQLHECILTSYGFDQKHQATFYRSNDNWQQGREISLEKYDKSYRAEPLLMDNTVIGSEIKETNQHFLYEYDFKKNWLFQIELINVQKEEKKDLITPYVSRVEGLGPQQYGNKHVLDNQFLDIEEKYDLGEGTDGFGEEGDAGASDEEGFIDSNSE